MLSSTLDTEEKINIYKSLIKKVTFKLLNKKVISFHMSIGIWQIAIVVILVVYYLVEAKYQV